MKRLMFLSFALLTFLWVADACASPALHPGAFEFRTSVAAGRNQVSFDGEDTFSRTEADVQVFGGVCLTSWVEIGAGFLYQYSSVEPEGEESTSLSSYGIVPQLVLNFPTGGPVVPFIAGGGGVVFYSGDRQEDESATILPRAEAGLRFFVKDAATLNVGLVYAHWTNLDGTKDLEMDRFGVEVGISLFP